MANHGFGSTFLCICFGAVQALPDISKFCYSWVTPLL